MNSRYSSWIKDMYPTKKSAFRKCDEATKKIVKEFPELKRVRGTIKVLELGGYSPTETTHYWCVTKEGKIIDPTGHQYPTEILEYKEYDESLGEPSGICPNCGELRYSDSHFCSEKCSREYLSYLNI